MPVALKWAFPIRIGQPKRLRTDSVPGFYGPNQPSLRTAVLLPRLGCHAFNDFAAGQFILFAIVVSNE